MQFSVPIFVVVLLLGVVQLAVGVVFGRYLTAGSGSRPHKVERDDAKRLQFHVGRFRKLVARVAKDVDDHHAQIEQANRRLASAQTIEGDQLTEFVLKSVTHIVQVNERLHSRLRIAEEKLEEQTEQIKSHLVEARTDSLTGLPNRRAFDDALSRRITDWKRLGIPLGMMMIDIDLFKRLNDQYGHAAGDHVLRRVADVLKTTLRAVDLVARVGGEEFAVVVPGADLANAQSATERCRRAVAAESFLFDGVELHATISLGLAMIEEDDDAILLAKRADEALYAAKHAGRDRAYYHTGQTCRPITRQGQTTDSSPVAETCDPGDPAEPKPESKSKSADDVELASLCDALRTKVAQL